MTVDVGALADWAKAITAIVACLGLVVVPIHKTLKQTKKDNAALMAGIQVLLHFRLERECRRVLDRGSIDVEEQQAISDIYNAYHDLGGNGHGTDLFNRTMKLDYRRNEDDYK